MLVFELQSVSLIPTGGPEPISYRGASLGTLLRATVYVFTRFAECTGTYKLNLKNQN
jgi:hypothetical protein